MHEVSPQQSIPVVYVISDPNDTTTYYPQAILRDSTSGATIQTLNLALASTGRYTGVFNPVADTSGLGRYVDVTVTVYTDSGHTTVSGNYAVVYTPYRVIQAWLPSLGNGGGTSFIDYKKIKEIYGEESKGVIELLEHRFNENKPIPGEKLDYDKIRNIVDRLPVDTPEERNERHQAVLSLLQAVQRTLQDIKNDPSVYQSSNQVRTALESAIADSKKTILEDMQDSMRTFESAMRYMLANFENEINRMIDEKIEAKELTVNLGSLDKKENPLLVSAKSLV